MRSSYEEMVVDSDVDRAWMTFRLRLAEHLAAISDADDDEVVLTPTGVDDEKSPRIEIDRCAGDALTLRICSSWRPEHRFRFSSAARQRLRDLGSSIVDGEPRFAMDPHLVDEAAHLSYVVLHEMWEVVHPSFVSVEPLDLALYDEPVDDEPQGPPEVPDLVHPSSQEELTAWVDAALTPEFGHVPRKDDDGDICVSGSGGGRAVVSVRSCDRVEVWTILADDVRHKKARKAVDRLSLRHPYVRFFLARDTLVASVVVPASPFAPDHLVRSLNLVLRLSEERGRELDAELSRRPRDDDSGLTEPVDATLQAIFNSSGQLRAADLVQLVIELAEDNEDVVDSWLRSSRSARDEAYASFEGLETGRVRDAFRLSARYWRLTVSALEAAIGQLTGESRSA